MAKTDAEPYPLVALDPKSLTPGFGAAAGSDVPRLTPAQSHALAGLALFMALRPGAPKDVLTFGGPLRLAVRAAHAPAAGMGLAAEDVERYAPFLRSDPAERKRFLGIDAILATLAMVGRDLLAEYAAWALEAANAEGRLTREIADRETAIAELKRVTAIYTRATAQPARR